MDIQATYNNNTGVIDWVFQNGDLQPADSDLVSSIMLQLFTDARADDSFTPSDGDLRGFWGNSYTTYPVGSKLWQLERAYFSGKSNIQLQARDYTRECLQPFVDQGIASKVDVNVQKLSNNAIAIGIVMTKPITNSTLAINFSLAWSQLASNPTAGQQVIINSIVPSG